MARNRGREVIPENFKTLDEFDEFWSTHSLADYDDLQHEAHFNITLNNDETVRLKPTLVRALRERAKRRRTTIGSLVNRMLEEKLEETA